MHTMPRPSGPVDRIYIHDNEGPESQNGAQALVNYLQRIEAGYHRVRDDKYTVTAAPDNVVVYGAGGDNLHTLHICLIGRAAQTASEWSDPYSAAAVEGAAQVVAAWCKAYRVPVVHVRPGTPGHAPTDRGIAMHADNHHPKSEGHTDPGHNFPIDYFIDRVENILSPKPTAAQTRAIHIAYWYSRVIRNPLRFGQRNGDVQIMQNLLHAKGFLKKPGNFYGLHAVVAVHKFKLAHKLANSDGKGFGRFSAAAILKP